MTQIHQGIYLHLDSTQKFKTINFTINFLAPATADNIGQRALLCEILENSNAMSHTPAEIASQLETLYGANFSLSHFVEGQVSVVSVSGICPAAQFLPDQEDVLTPLLSLVKASLFNPAQSEDGTAFAQDVFKREKDNLMRKINAYLDDKQYAAILGTKALYYGADSPMAMPAMGSLAAIEALNPTQLWTYFQQMMAHDQIFISVTGDDPKLDLETLFDWPQWQDRQDQPLELNFTQPLFTEVKQQQKAMAVTQGKLNLMYQVPVRYYQDNYFAYLLANTVFGGSAQSLLFLNVREKASLAYYASSALDTFTGTVLVQTGIDSDKQAQVQDTIAQQLQALQSGDFDPILIENAKKMLIDQFSARGDSPFGRNLRYLFQFLVPQVIMEPSIFAQRVSEIDKADIQRAAQSFQLQAVYAIEREA